MGRSPVGSAWSEVTFGNSIYSRAILPRKAEGMNWSVPFASITWSRFNGSAALPRSTLSLRAETTSATGWLPCNDLTLGWVSRRVKLGLHFNSRGFHADVVQHYRGEDHAGKAEELLAKDQGQQCQPQRIADAVPDDLAVEEVFQLVNDHQEHEGRERHLDRKSTRLNSRHANISYAV